MAQDIDRKLRLTATLLGTVARKDLAAAFRRVNANTSFDVGRADKWLQGRAQPRERQVYEDWAKVLELDRPGQWVADCDTEAFLDEISVRHGRDRGELSIENEPNPARLVATYVQNLPTGVAQLNGSIALNQRTLGVELYHSETNERYNMCLFRPMPPVGVTVGYFSGITTFLSPDTELTASRIVFIRLPPTSARRSTAAYLSAEASVAANLAALGLPVRNPAEVDRRLAEFLMTGHERDVDRIAADQYAGLTELFDRNWLGEIATAEA